jgi:hypothetical protein
MRLGSNLVGMIVREFGGKARGKVLLAEVPESILVRIGVISLDAVVRCDATSHEDPWRAWMRILLHTPELTFDAAQRYGCWFITWVVETSDPQDGNDYGAKT